MNTQSSLCEETSPCINYPSAICLHCNRRLCIAHITEHNRLVTSSYEELTKELEEATQRINNEYEKTRGIYQNILTTINDWRTRQLQKIAHVYESHLQCIETRQEILSTTHQQLTELLDREARQPLKHVLTHQAATEGALTQIRQTIKNIQENDTKLKWNFPGAPMVKTQDLPADFQSTAVASTRQVSSRQVSSTSDSWTSPRRKLVLNLSSLRDINLRKFRAFRRLVDMFGNTSCIEQSKQDIEEYIKKQYSGLHLPVLISSYLLAWYRNTNAHEKDTILNEYLPIVMKHVSSSANDYTFLLGIHAFFNKERLEGNRRDMMTYLLQFFVEHKCLTRNQIFYWYYNKDEDLYKGFDGAKQMTAPFIKSLWADKKDTVVQTSSTESGSGEPREMISE